MKGMSIGQFIPGNSIIHRIDSRMKIVCLIFLFIAVISTTSIYGYGLVLLTIATIVKLSCIPLKVALSLICKLWVFFIVIFLMNAFFYDADQPIFSWWLINLSHGGIRQGFRVVLNVSFIMVLGTVLTSTTAPIEMTNALEWLLKPLKLLRIPVEDVAMIINVSIQFIPTLIDEAEMIRKAQTARGARFESKKLREKALSYLPLLIPLFLASFRRADELSVAMEARGYRNAKNRTKKTRTPLSTHDFTALTSIAVISIFKIFII